MGRKVIVKFPQRAFIIVASLATIVAIALYAYAARVGVEIVTSPDAFVLPAPAPPSTKSADGTIKTVIETTPAPWPPEAARIYRIASLGIPVRVVVKHANGPISFIVERANDGHLIGTFQSEADATALSLMVPEGEWQHGS